MSAAHDVRPEASAAADGVGAVVIGEARARRILVLRACETEPVAPALWSPEDAAWASRLASETAGPAAGALRWLDERARHAAERLAARDRRLALLLQPPRGRAALAWAVLLIAALVGLVADTLGGRLYVDVLAPPVLAALAWNFAVYAWLGARALRTAAGAATGAASAGPAGPAAASPPSSPTSPAGGLRRWLATALQQGGGPLRSFGVDWARRSAPAMAARVACVLHLAAAALAGGLVAGLYLRGLVLDFRAGWQSTFLEPSQVHALLGALLAPASALTGITMPDEATIAALRIGPDEPPTLSAAPWIHLFSATLVLAVIVPRLLLAALAAAQAGWRSQRMTLALADPYFQRLLAVGRRRQARVQLLPHGAPPSAQAALALQAVLTATLGEGTTLRVAAAVPYGDEEPAVLPAVEPGTTLRLALFDLATTPEPQVQGRFVDALRADAAQPLLLLLVDEAAQRSRFAALPQRLEERRVAWRRFAEEHHVGLACIDLAAADPGAGARELDAALMAGAR